MLSRSSKNFRNITHVNIGRRSRSPLRPLSFRMMSRADLMRLPSCWAVVRGCFVFFANAIPYVDSVTVLGSVEKSLHFVDSATKLFNAAEVRGDLHHVTV